MRSHRCRITAEKPRPRTTRDWVVSFRGMEIQNIPPQLCWGWGRTCFPAHKAAGRRDGGGTQLSTLWGSTEKRSECNTGRLGGSPMTWSDVASSQQCQTKPALGIAGHSRSCRLTGEIPGEQASRQAGGEPSSRRVSVKESVEQCTAAPTAAALQ